MTERIGLASARRGAKEMSTPCRSSSRALGSSTGRSLSHPMNPARPPSRATATSAVATLPPWSVMRPVTLPFPALSGRST